MLDIIKADYSNSRHADNLAFMLNSYAKDPMGGGRSLGEFTKANLAKKLAQVAGAITLLAYRDSTVVGLLNAFEGFSTFHCKKILNIHDLAVLAEYRQQGIATALLTAVDKEAARIDCCKLTLEVLTGNKAAWHAYKKYGFKGYELDPKMGQAMFLEKELEG